MKKGKSLFYLAMPMVTLDNQKTATEQKVSKREFQLESYILHIVTYFTFKSTTTSSSGETCATETVIDHLSECRPKFYSCSALIAIGITYQFLTQRLRGKQMETESYSRKNYHNVAFLLDLESVDWELPVSTAFYNS